MHIIFFMAENEQARANAYIAAMRAGGHRISPRNAKYFDGTAENRGGVPGGAIQYESCVATRAAAHVLTAYRKAGVATVTIDLDDTESWNTVREVPVDAGGSAPQNGPRSGPMTPESILGGADLQDGEAGDPDAGEGDAAAETEAGPDDTKTEAAPDTGAKEGAEPEPVDEGPAAEPEPVDEGPAAEPETRVRSFDDWNGMQWFVLKKEAEAIAGQEFQNKAEILDWLRDNNYVA